ncbi:MAG: type VI secretion system baseplate subunit TssG [Pseudomonadota bacterium]
MEAEIRPAPGALAPARPGGAELLAQIGADPSGYQLFALLRLLECHFPELPLLGQAKRPRDEPVRIGADPSLVFAPSAVTALALGAPGAPARLVQRVLGLFGANGPMPTHLSEYAFERAHHAQDQTMVRFADIFHHRMVSLFYRAWAVNQPAVSLDRPGHDRFGAYLGALCGLGMPSLRGRDAVHDFVKLGHAGIFGSQVKNAEGLQTVLENHFGVAVRVAQWQGHWLDIPRSERSRLGARAGFSVLGQDVVIGERLWDRQSKFRIVLGPLTVDQYQGFLPGARGHARLADLVRLYIGVELAWDLQLRLLREQVPLSWLGNSVLLGWTSWLGVRLAERDADDLVLADHALPGLGRAGPTTPTATTTTGMP